MLILLLLLMGYISKYVGKKVYNTRNKKDGVTKPYNLRNRKKVNYDEREIKVMERNIIIKDEDDDINIPDSCLDLSWDEFNVYQTVENDDESNNKDWISATAVKNYLLNDPLLDWLELYYIEKERRSNTITDIINEDRKQLNIFFEMGKKFEDEVIKCIKNRYPNDIIKVCDKYPNPDLHNLTCKYMLGGVPIIEQAVLYNFKNKTFGVADLLVRSDWINRLFIHPVLDDKEIVIKGPMLNGQYHYRVIDIKWTTTSLCSNGITIRNSNRFPAYKGQLAIYNAIIGQIQGYTPDKTYILSKSWHMQTGKHKHEGHNCFNRLGVIDYSEFDMKYIKNTFDAIKWVRNVRFNGQKWDCYNPSIPELYPNMCNRYDTPYHHVKKMIADKLKDPTQIWMVGVKNRRIAHTNGIYAWDDPKCNSYNMGINGKKIGPIINKIIEVNRNKKDIIVPKKIRNNAFNWKTKSNADFYLDFEGITGCLYNRDINPENSKSDSQILFLIGVGYVINDEWNYKHFLSNSVSINEENRIVNEFVNFIKGYAKNNKARFFHWSHAEKSIFNILDKRHNNAFREWKDSVQWIDMCKVFIDEPIIIKGALKFNLKDLAKAMRSHNMIRSDWNINGSPENGLDAMFKAIDYYRYMESDRRTDRYDLEYKSKMDAIVNYNEVDCKVVWEIVDYLRKKHV